MIEYMQRQNLFYDLTGKYGVVVPGNLMDELFNYAIQKMQIRL